MDRRREQLETWRKMTGRTPMKRLSYVQPCYFPPTEKKPTTSKPAAHRVYPRTEVKKPKRAGPLVPLIQNMKAHKSNVAVQCSLLTPAADRDAMKEAFQRDIDDTVACILAEDVGSTIIRGLSFDDSFCTTSQDQRASLECPEQITPRPNLHKKRRSCMYSMDQSKAFKSSKICYSLISSEYRGRKRRQRSNEKEVDGDSMLYLTPVRRTSRRSRSICPHLEPRGDPCFVSPSELVEKEGRDNVRVLPNEALQVLQGTEPLVGANCFQ